MTPLELKVLQLERRLAMIEKSDRFTFQKDLQIFDGRDIFIAKGRGTLIGTENSQKLGFFGARSNVPIAQPTADTFNAATNIYSTAFFADDTYGNNEKNQINNMWNAMVGLGLIREI